MDPRARADDAAGDTSELPKEVRSLVLPLMTWQGGKPVPVDEQASFAAGRRAAWLLHGDRLDEARAWLEEAGWKATAPET